MTVVQIYEVAAVAKWSRYRIMAGFVTCSNPVPLKNRRVEKRLTLNLSRAQTSSRWCGSSEKGDVSSATNSSILPNGDEILHPKSMGSALTPVAYHLVAHFTSFHTAKIDESFCQVRA
ncbi:hypothetical protein TNCV_302471 [Trichonephila clavipes]|nr:hypothetical protein TNCV_302471 [Trichonephila clavipes]